MPVGQPSLKQASGLAARTALLGAPVMALLFLLFPRVGRLSGRPTGRVSKTGLSNTMEMGSITPDRARRLIAMRMRLDGPAPPPTEMHFRGPVLTRFDGSERTPLACRSRCRACRGGRRRSRRAAHRSATR